MDLIQLSDGEYLLSAGANAGLVVRDGRALVVDTGLDRDSAKKIIKLVDGAGFRLVAVAITHAHADHFGGAATLRARLDVPVYASRLEAAIVENPILEPLYLFSGAYPIPELRHKFTLAEPCVVDGILEPGAMEIAGIRVQVHAAPGHAPNQVMISCGETCFAGDAVFPPDVLAKHGIPFCADIDQALKTFEAVTAVGRQLAVVVPGHGMPTSNVAEWCSANADRLVELRDIVGRVLVEQHELGAIIEATATNLRVEIGNPVSYFLAQTTVLACLASLQKAGHVETAMRQNRLSWQRC